MDPSRFLLIFDMRGMQQTLVRRHKLNGLNCSRAIASSTPNLPLNLSAGFPATLPADAMTTLDQAIRQTQSESPKLATRKASQNAIEVVAKVFPEVLGGSADLGHSNLTVWPHCQANTVDESRG